MLAAVERALVLPLTTAELEAQRFVDRLEAVGIDQVHITLDGRQHSNWRADR